MTLKEQKKALYKFADDCVKYQQDYVVEGRILFHETLDDLWDGVDPDGIWEAVEEYYEKMPDKKDGLAEYVEELRDDFPVWMPSYLTTQTEN